VNSAAKHASNNEQRKWFMIENVCLSASFGGAHAVRPGNGVGAVAMSGFQLFGYRKWKGGFGGWKYVIFASN